MKETYKPVYPCPNPKKKGCFCLDVYFIETKALDSFPKFKNMQEVIDYLLRLRSKALFLSKQPGVIKDCKFNSTDHHRGPTKISKKLKANEYTDYIFETRRILKENGICEVSCQNILGYSNNLIYRYLKFDHHDRNTSILVARPKYPKKTQIIPFEKLMSKECCKSNCNKLIEDNIQYFENLRAQAQMSRKNKRKCIEQLKDDLGQNFDICKQFIIDALAGLRKLVIQAKQQRLIRHHRYLKEIL
ncbi:hypothetical protein RF11_03313 [Thelohanellus kitauei]|uniref:Uncharacterized protein n=1 Tax=Thelohanellus kitauei TaxID=669202 RepID=A0A0C2JG54_THEKT|nr:hypothetical protein RF11_03313 [Thelohanellus kitauei]